jgi:hypothetical protein
MSDKENDMNLIDRYTNEIGRYLPRKSRADIQEEIRSTIEDILEDHSREVGKPVNDEMTAQVLKEYGSPKKVAASYLPERYLIGPRIYPLFMLVLKIVLTVIGLIALIRLGVDLSQAAPGIQQALKTIGQAILEFLGSALQVLGNLILVFVILERFIPDLKMEEDEDWDPSQLKQMPTSDQVRLWEPILTIVMTLAALVIFNFYPHLLGIGFVQNGAWTFIPLLSEAFFRYLTWINAVWVLQIFLQLILLRRGGWEPLTRWLSIGIQLLGIALAYVLLRGPSLVGLTPQALAAAPLDAHTAYLIILVLNQVVKFALVITILVGSIEVIRSVYRLLIRPQMPEIPINS